MSKLTFNDIIKSDEDHIKELTSNERDKSLDKLLEIWKNTRNEYEVFCEDGILLENDWDNSRTKILFLLKETFRDFSIIKGKQGPNGNSKTFWRKMQMWTFIIDKIFNNEEVTHLEAIKIKEKPNTETAYVNIKKNVTKNKQAYKTNSNDEDIKKYAISDAILLKKQIDLINPNVIICCGTYKYLKHILPINANQQNKYNSIWVVDYRHLSNRKGYKFDNEDLILKLKNIKNIL